MFNDLTNQANNATPMKKPISPKRLKIIAFRAALHAVSLEFQKLINKNEHIPTPSQPIISTPKSDAETKSTIKKVNKER